MGVITLESTETSFHQWREQRSSRAELIPDHQWRCKTTPTPLILQFIEHVFAVSSITVKLCNANDFIFQRLIQGDPTVRAHCIAI